MTRPDFPKARLLRPGETCWRIERADRVAVMVDAADNFATVRAAVQQARHSVMLIGWDFDTRSSSTRSMASRRCRTGWEGF